MGHRRDVFPAFAQTLKRLRSQGIRHHAAMSAALHRCGLTAQASMADESTSRISTEQQFAHSIIYTGRVCRILVMTRYHGL